MSGAMIGSAEVNGYLIVLNVIVPALLAVLGEVPTVQFDPVYVHDGPIYHGRGYQ